MGLSLDAQHLRQVAGVVHGIGYKPQASESDRDIRRDLSPQMELMQVGWENFDWRGVLASERYRDMAS